MKTIQFIEPGQNWGKRSYCSHARSMERVGVLEGTELSNSYVEGHEENDSYHSTK